MTGRAARPTVLVTGASGLIGRHVVPTLLARGYDVHGAVRHPPSDNPEVSWHALDLSDHASVDSLVGMLRPRHLLHLAWDIRGDYYTSPRNIGWLCDSLHLFQSFVDAGGERLVGAGTASEYDPSGGADLAEGLTPLRPSELYGLCKKALGEIGALFAQRRSVSFAWGRVFPCYGPGEHPTRTIPSLLDALARADRVPFEDGRGVRDYVYVTDVAEAFAALLDRRIDGTFNIGTGVPTTVRAFVTKIAAAAGRPDSIDIGAAPTPSYEPVRIVADTTRIRTEIGWSARWKLDDGIRETVAWWRTAQSADLTAGGRRSAR